MISARSRAGVARCWTLVRSPGGDSLLFALRCSDRRRIGGVGAGRSHPRSRRRTESRAHQAGRLARVPPRPSLTGDLTAAPEGNGVSSEESRADAGEAYADADA